MHVRGLVLVVALCGTAAAGSAPDLALARGKALLDSGDHAAAALVLDELVATFPASPQAGEAAILVLDALNRDRDLEALVAKTEYYLRDRPLRRHRELTDVLHKLRFQMLRSNMVAPAPIDLEREALANLEDFASAPDAPNSDDLLFAAGWQFCVTHHPDAAGRAWRVLVALVPSSRLVGRAELGLADLATCDGSSSPASSRAPASPSPSPSP